ncbi:MAG: hypothetical protein R3C16_02680 [Hyphomonadaceae bacterium]
MATAAAIITAPQRCADGDDGDAVLGFRHARDRNADGVEDGEDRLPPGGRDKQKLRPKSARIFLLHDRDQQPVDD